MKNYICINGNKTELTPEQLKQLGIEIPKVNPFKRANKYYSITQHGQVDWHYDVNDDFDNGCFNTANYCTDKSLMKQRALHETLNRLLWRYSMEHDGDKIDWMDRTDSDEFYICPDKYYIYFDHLHKQWGINYSTVCNNLMVYFYTEGIAEAAIEEIVKPFMEAHPDFKC